MVRLSPGPGGWMASRARRVEQRECADLCSGRAGNGLSSMLLSCELAWSRARMRGALTVAGGAGSLRVRAGARDSLVASFNTREARVERDARVPRFARPQKL